MDIRFVSREGDSLVFESDAGERFYVVIDDSLKNSLKNNPRVTTADFSPKFVQDEIRLGKSVEDIALDLSVEASSLAPFAAPILDELRFVLQAALDTQVADGSIMRRFEDLVLESIPTASFRVFKKDAYWTIEVPGDTLLTWRFDPKLRHIEPLSDQAANLARVHSNRDVISSTQQAVRSAPEQVELAANEAPPTEVADESTASVHSLVEELRTRRKQEVMKPATAKGRASLPSWDEIVLGATNSETDSD